MVAWLVARHAPRRMGQRSEPAILQIKSLVETRQVGSPPRSYIEQSTSFDARKIRFCGTNSGPQSRANPFRSPQHYLTGIVGNQQLRRTAEKAEHAHVGAGESTDDRGRKTRTTEARDKRRGIPQGSPLSPLLANIYMRRFVLGWKMFGLERSLGTRLITYADDLVILCRRGKAEAALQSLREIMGKLKLTVNEEKTRICKVPEGEFDFLGYTFGRMFSARTGQARIGYRPSKKSIQRVVEKVHALTDRSGTWQETTTRRSPAVCKVSDHKERKDGSTKASVVPPGTSRRRI